MTPQSRITLDWRAAAALAIAFLAIGAGAVYIWFRAPQARRADEVPASPKPQIAPPASASPAVDRGPLPDVVVPLTADASARAGIETTRIAAGAGSEVRIAGVVEPNAYRQVTVTPIAAGRVTRVLASLGDRVRRGQTLAQVYSPELADAQTQYVSFVAELEAAHQELQRTERLVEIGAASRQELEKIRAEHASHASHVEGARSKLVLLGMSGAQIEQLNAASEISATVAVPAPIAGVITARDANPGLNVEASTKLFTVVDLTSVWIVGDLYERDFARVRVGSPVTITTTAYPDLELSGRVSYIDPQVSPETRTARVRVEVANPRAELRLGMYAELRVAAAAETATVLVPRSAIQTVGDRQVVYLADERERGRFIEREVRLGQSSGDQVEAVSGVRQGDAVVTRGSFFLRAERDRLGLRQPSASPQSSQTPPAGAAPNVQAARVIVSDRGYEPERLTVRAGPPVRLTFVRTSDNTCGTEVVFPSLNVTRALPLNEPVTIEFAPAKSGEIAFVCGMNMLRGAIVVQ